MNALVNWLASSVGGLCVRVNLDNGCDCNSPSHNTVLSTSCLQQQQRTIRWQVEWRTLGHCLSPGRTHRHRLARCGHSRCPALHVQSNRICALEECHLRSMSCRVPQVWIQFPFLALCGSLSNSVFVSTTFYFTFWTYINEVLSSFLIDKLNLVKIIYFASC